VSTSGLELRNSLSPILREGGRVDSPLEKLGLLQVNRLISEINNWLDSHPEHIELLRRGVEGNLDELGRGDLGFESIRSALFQLDLTEDAQTSRDQLFVLLGEAKEQIEQEKKSSSTSSNRPQQIICTIFQAMQDLHKALTEKLEPAPRIRSSLMSGSSVTGSSSSISVEPQLGPENPENGNACSNRLNFSPRGDLVVQAHIPGQLSRVDDKTSKVVVEQLKNLIEICKKLSKSESGISDLLDLSLGIGCLPKGKKFSQKWIGILSEIQWVLLEDISRQISKGIVKNSPDILGCAKTLKVVFETLMNVELDRPISCELPFRLPETENLFRPQLDNYLLHQIDRHIQVIKDSLREQNFDSWLTDPIHIKALFRTIQVIGEASKIISTTTKQRLPSLQISKNGNALWVKLRNQLHHNKRRSWDIVKYAPDQWEKLWFDLMEPLAKEIRQCELLNHFPISESEMEKKKESENAAFMESLVQLCEGENFREIHPLWNKIQTDFTTEPSDLARILFGLKKIEEHEFPNVWDKYAKPHLKPEVDQVKNKGAVYEILRMAKGILIRESDIAELSTSKKVVGKKAAIEEMKRLLAAIRQNENEKNKDCGKQYDQLIDQLVFLKQRKTKHKELEKLMSARFKQIEPAEFSKRTFKHADGSLSPYGKLLDLHIKLKIWEVQTNIDTMRRLLEEIAKTWPSEDITEANVQTFGRNKNPKGKLKTTFIGLLQKFLLVREFVGLSFDKDAATLTAELKIFSPNKINFHFKNKGKLEITNSELVDKINKSKSKCLETVESLKNFLNQEESIVLNIERFMWDRLGEVSQCFNEALQQNVENLGSIKEAAVDVLDAFFDFCGFRSTLKNEDIQKFIKELEKANIKCSLDFDPFPDLISLRLKVKSTLKGLGVDWGAEVNRLTTDAEEALSEEYVQDTLRTSVNILPLLTQLGEIYRSGLDKEACDDKKALGAWDAIERKANGKHLSLEKWTEVINLLPTDGLNEDEKKVKAELIQYMDGIQTEAMSALNLQNLSRSEHSQEKIKAFEIFLESKCFRKFPDLQLHRELLLNYFKIAYRIVDVQNKANDFSGRFSKKAGELGILYSQIFKPKEEQPSNRKLLLQAAGYDMQTIGEMAQLITKRPNLWHLGRHILSAQHISSISLMRKMMAHYPLQLSSSSMRWNLAYLAFDARTTLSQTNPAVYFETIQAPKRKIITAIELRERVFEIKDYLDRLHLDIHPKIIYPSLSISPNTYLHPFGDLAILVYPGQIQQKTEFTHAVMELELILSHELDAKVSVVGSWTENERVNIPSKKHLPADHLKKMISTSQSMEDWITSNHAYEIFQEHPWSYVIYKSGRKVSRGDYDLHHDLVDFFRMLDFTGSHEDLKRFLQMEGLNVYIHDCLTKMWKIKGPYPESQLFHFVCYLFERFSPPHVKPKYPVRLPKQYGHARPITMMIDTNDYGLQLLPEKINEFEGNVERYYYADGQRLDLLGGHSLLDPAYPVTESELRVVADYAAAVLGTQASYILEKFHSDYRLDRGQFTQINGIVLNDPVLVEDRKALNAVSKDVAELIEKESAELVERIITLISDFIKKHQHHYPAHMLDWMHVDKKIEQLAREYYHRNRGVLKKDYLELDENSRNFFDRHYIKKNLDKHFPFVSSFRNFLNRLHRETKSIHINQEDGKILRADFSPGFKALVVESSVQKDLLELMKKREVIMWMAQKAFLKQNPKYANIPGGALDPINDIYFKWDKLFRMVQSPEVFLLLHECIQSQKEVEAIENKKSLQEVLEKDFENQYKTSIIEREESSARTSLEEMRLYEARDYFDGKCKTAQVQKDYDRFKETLQELRFWEQFESEWKSVYAIEYLPQYDKELVSEAREMIDFLLVKKRLPDYNFKQVPSYREYWDFVNSDQTSMCSSWMCSALNKSFKQLLIDQTSYDQFTQDPEIKKALQKDKRIEKLVRTYMSFFNFENEMSDWSNYRKLQAERYKKLQHEMEEASKSGDKGWILDEYQRRLEHTNSRLEIATEKFNQTFNQAMQTDFFQLMKFSAKWQFVLEHSMLPSEEEIQRRAEQQLQGMFVIEGSILDDYFSPK